MYIPLRWIDGRWTVHPCPATEAADRREECEKWVASNADILPTPLRQVGDHVRFNWSGTVMTGDVREVMLSYASDRKLGADEDHFVCRGISYTIYANGHGRWVNQENLLDI